MASGIFAILDDISMLMDDVAAMSKIATKKTAGILGDDLAVNAEKATGFVASREIPVLWAITKGSFINKLIILPLVFILNFFAPILIKYVLLAGGFYLAYEGVHKVIEFIIQKTKPSVDEKTPLAPIKEMDESAKISSAVRTDFILSIEIVIIALSSVFEQPLFIQIATVSIVALLATVGVYGIVALIVRMDDFGWLLINKSNGKRFIRRIGHFLVRLLPYVIKSLSVIGTIALLLVSGGIFLHNHIYIPEFLHQLPSMLQEFLAGCLYGSVTFIIFEAVKALIGKIKFERKV